MNTPHHTPARVTFIGMQERVNKPAIPLYNFHGPSMHGIEVGSTVTMPTIKAAGFFTAVIREGTLFKTVTL
jgi:hypothetical protein